jgi:hypothetical protein
LALLVVLCSTRQAGPNTSTPKLVSLAVPARTLERWRLWWREAFLLTPLWLGACAAFMPTMDLAQLPDSLLERFLGADAAARMSALLRFLCPLTVRSRPATDHAA